MHKIIKPGDDEQNQSATIPARELTRVIHGVYHLNKTFVFGFLYVPWSSLLAVEK